MIINDDVSYFFTVTLSSPFIRVIKKVSPFLFCSLHKIIDTPILINAEKEGNGKWREHL